MGSEYWKGLYDWFRPAKAGTWGQISNLSPKKDWIPAFAGMTIRRISGVIQSSQYGLDKKSRES